MVSLVADLGLLGCAASSSNAGRALLSLQHVGSSLRDQTPHPCIAEGRSFFTEPGKPGDPEFFGENPRVSGVYWWNMLEIFPLGYQGKLFMQNVSHQRHSTKTTPGCTRGSCWSLVAAGCCYSQREPRSKPFLPEMFPQLSTDKT